MNMRRLTRILCLLLLAGLVQAPLLKADEKMAGERDLKRVRKKVEALRAWQLTEVLDLDEETISRLFPAMKQADQERWKIEARNRELVREMSRSLESRSTDSQRIDKILDELQSNRRELIRSEERHLERVRQILSPEDTARYLMFQIKFQREIKRKAAQAFRDRRRSDNDRGNGDRYNDSDSGSGGSGGGDGSGSGRR
jgi:Spy/CpxP family protein refolding chaperone